MLLMAPRKRRHEPCRERMHLRIGIPEPATRMAKLAGVVLSQARDRTVGTGDARHDLVRDGSVGAESLRERAQDRIGFLATSPYGPSRRTQIAVRP
jgi:hypothetical protein